MSIYYLDTSALVKYYILESGSTWVRTLLDAIDPQTQQWTHTIFFADVTVAEMAAAFAILHRVGRIRKSVWTGVYDRFMDDVVQRYRLVHASVDDFFAAAQLTQQHPLKAYDAVQLSIALRYQQHLSTGGFSLTFISGDSTLLTAAQATGLITDDPFDHVVSEDHPQTPKGAD
jgi:predicted nucleic acid-binding protein